jgi:hypothetical protein
MHAPCHGVQTGQPQSGLPRCQPRLAKASDTRRNTRSDACHQSKVLLCTATLEMSSFCNKIDTRPTPQVELCTARSSSVYGRRPVLTGVFSAQNAQRRTHAAVTSRKIHPHGRLHPLAAAKVRIISTRCSPSFQKFIAKLAVPSHSLFHQYSSLTQLCMQTEEASGVPKPNERFSRKVKQARCLTFMPTYIHCSPSCK